MKYMMKFFRHQSPGLLITLGFASVILLGALLLLLPCAVREDAEVSFMDALFTSTSAVCVTGLIAVDTADHFTAIGQGMVALLIHFLAWGIFQSVSARTAGFSTYPIGTFTNAGLFALCILMFIGASPGSTGGGIKTSTFFVLIQAVKSNCTKSTAGAFRRSISRQNISKACMITVLSAGVVCVAAFEMCLLEPKYSFIQPFFETVSAFGTVGLSTGITPDLCSAAKMVLILVMFTGRLGAFTLFTMWIDRPKQGAHYSEENISIG